MIKKKIEKDGFTFYEYLGNNITDSRTNIYTGVPLSEIKKIKTKIEIIEHNNFGESGYIFITSKASPTAELSRMFVGLKHDKSAGIGIGSTVYNNNIATTTLNVSSSNIAVIGGWSDTSWTTYYRYKEIVFYDNNNKIIRDFVPASNGREYGLYDLSNDVFYSNQGNGSFVVSEDFACVVRAVSRICKGVKSECRLELDGSENWILYTSGTVWVGVYLTDCLLSGLTRAAHYSNYFGFTAKNVSSRFIWVGANSKHLYVIWAKGNPPAGYEHWEKDGDADIDAIKADLAKKHLIIWYDNTDSSVGSMSALIPIIARDVNKVKKVINGTAVDVFTRVTSEVVEGVVEVGPAKVSDGVLEIKGDNVKVENNKLIIK